MRISLHISIGIAGVWINWHHLLCFVWLRMAYVFLLGCWTWRWLKCLHAQTPPCPWPSGPGSQWSARDGCASLNRWPWPSCPCHRHTSMTGPFWPFLFCKNCKRLHDFSGCCHILSRDVYMVGRSWKHFDQLNTGAGRMQKFVPSWSRFTGRCTNLWRPSLSCGPWCPMVSHGAFDYGGASMAEKQSSRKAALRKKVPWPIRGTPRGTPRGTSGFTRMIQQTSAKNKGLAGSWCHAMGAWHVMQTQLLHRSTLVRNCAAQVFDSFQNGYIILYHVNSFYVHIHFKHH